MSDLLEKAYNGTSGMTLDEIAEASLTEKGHMQDAIKIVEAELDSIVKQEKYWMNMSFDFSTTAKARKEADKTWDKYVCRAVAVETVLEKLRKAA